MSKMKTNQARVIPIVRDLEQQFAEHPECTSVFMYDDGGVYRAFACEDVNFGNPGSWVSATIGGNRIVVIPEYTPWRLINRDTLDLRTGKEIETARLMGLYEDSELREELVKKIEAVKPIKEKKPKADKHAKPTVVPTGQYL